MCPEAELEAQSVSHGADLIVRLRRLLFSRLLRLLRRILLRVKGSCVPLSQLMFCPQGITMLLMLVVVLVAAAPEHTAEDEASEHSGFERHGVADTTKKTPLSGLRKHFPKQLWENIKMLENDTKFQAQTERANFCSFQI